MLKHCSPSSVDIRRRSRRNLLTIVDNADVSSDIVITDHVYDIEDSKEDDYAVPYDIRIEEDLELIEDDIEFDTTSIRSSYSTNTTSDSSCSSVSNLRSPHHHHRINLDNRNGVSIQQQNCQQKSNGNKRIQRYNNKNSYPTKNSSTSSMSSSASTINSSHRVILSLGSDESHISSIPNTSVKSSSNIVTTKSSVKSNLSQFYQYKAKDQKSSLIPTTFTSSEALSNSIENNGEKTEFSTLVDHRVHNNPIEISTSGITKTLITSQPLSSNSSAGSPSTIKCDIFSNSRSKQKPDNSPKRLNARVLKLSESSTQHESTKISSSSTPIKLDKFSSLATAMKPVDQQQPIKKMAIKIYSRCLSSDIEYKTLSVNHQTTAKEVIWLLLGKFKMKHRDPKLFYLTMDINIKRTGIPLRRTLSLDDDSRPAELKSCHPWGECRFTLQMRKGGLVRIHASVLMPESKYKCLLISEQTTTKEVIEILFHCYKLMDQNKHSIDQFCLYEQCPSQGYERRMHPDDQPVPLQSMWPSVSTETGNLFSFVLKKLSSEELANESNDLMMYSTHQFTGEHRFSPSSTNIHKNKSKFNCSDILEEEDSIELNDLVEDVIVDEVVTSVDDDNNQDIDIDSSSNMNILRNGANVQAVRHYDNVSNNSSNKKEYSRSDANIGTTTSGNQLDTSYSSSGECSTASSEYSALRFRDSPMSSSSRSRTSTDSSSMAITPSSSKETSSTTNSIVVDTFRKNSIDTSSFNQKEIYSLNDELSTSSVPFHRRLFNGQKGTQINRANSNHNVTHNEKTNKLKSNLKTISNRQEIDNSLPIGHHHFSLQSLLEALPAASVDTTNISEDQNSKHQNRDCEKVNKRSSLSSLSTNGSRASGDFDGFFYI